MDWSVRSALVTLTNGHTLKLIADGAGHWTDANGRPMPELDGCIDIDLSATPFSNSLPVWRLKLGQGERREILGRLLYSKIDGRKAA